jgi:uncharacterized membrane protein YphA (DoxX/SURF4 family)
MADMAAKPPLISRGQFLWSLRLSLAGIFLYAGGIKALHPQEFVRDLENYHLLSYPLAVGMALYLPWVEFICGIAILLPRWTHAATWLLMCLMLLFIAALAQGWLRGLNISCGCFGNYSGGILWPLGRDLILLTMLVSLERGAQNAHAWVGHRP